MEKLTQSRLILMELLNLLRQNAEISALAAVAKRDPGVTLKIIEMANSPLSGLTAPIASLEQALLILGREVLYRWLALSIYRTSNDGRDETLLEIALGRAFFLEQVAVGCRSKQESDELFLVGMLSLLDILLGLPMTKAIDGIILPQAIIDVLVKSEGPYARFLLLALAREKGRNDQAVKFATDIGLSEKQLMESGIAASMLVEDALLAA